MPEMIPLSRSAERTRAAEMIHTASAEPLVVTRPASLLLADLLDSLSWTVLDQASVDRDAARAILASLWVAPSAGITQWDGGS